MTTNYVPIKQQEMNQMLMGDMGFHQTIQAGGELVYERPVTTVSGKHYPYTIRVYSSIRADTGKSAAKGKDAIRVVLMDNMTGNPAKNPETRIHRTKNALPNLKKRCRAVFKQVLESEKCPKCGSMMVVRENRTNGHKFWACTRYSPNKPLHCNGTKPLDTK